MRILVVDDDYVSRSKLAALLASYGQCDSSPNGEIALKLFEEAHKESAPYELVTMDIEMPGMNGEEVVTQMRKIEEDLHVQDSAKILMVTVKRTLKDVSASYYRGCSGYLIKPTTPDGLKAALGEVGIKAGL